MPMTAKKTVTAPLHTQARTQVQTRLSLHPGWRYLDGGFDSTHNHKVIFNAGLIPNIPENPCNRNTTQSEIHETDHDNAKE